MNKIYRVDISFNSNMTNDLKFLTDNEWVFLKNVLRTKSLIYGNVINHTLL
jgi:hypothetical protein